MFTESAIEANNKQQFYGQIAEQLDHLLAGEANAIANLSNMSSLLNLHLKDINWVGFYLWSEGDGELILGPFQGKPACIRIPSGKGVCGAAAAKREPMVVEDVFSFPGHIACDPASRSEVVVPILVDGKLIGVLDIDSPTAARFDEHDAKGLERAIGILCKHTQF
ncbi:GAF domain-containing protein [Alicyclobacillus fastidiosus]|uniref:GAF domain-containing protein n=1 Tax=Alicyclobacillus fastidiosus TaxID=392011 RepID=A0ABV5AEE0_9BACL|nr:GAF domain-containing protein [Alicyclobacillus fastidiosus]WEH08549.1 GAF domain-containing protein [Alicyclobacillus fastidiosus]